MREKYVMDLVVPSRSPLRAALKSLATFTTLEKRNYVTGIALLICVVFLWSASGFVTQDLFEGGYEKPFLVTYLQSSSFVLYLIPIALKSIFLRFGSLSNCTTNEYRAIPVDSEAIDGDPTTGSQVLNHAAESELPPLTTSETIRLAFMFCFIWVAANWTLTASLDYTSVASSTIMASTSGFFTLGVGRMFGVETLSLTKVIAVMVSFLGIIIVSLSDSSYSSSTLKQLVSRNESSYPLFGDALALSSAALYAFYVTLLKVRIRSESRIKMQLFLGFVGLFNIVCFWPVGFIMDWTGMEKFELPSDRRTVIGILINMFITLSSDSMYVIAMLKTTPLVVTIGLSLTIPITVAGDSILNDRVKLLSIFGALLVLVSFVVIGLEDAEMDTSTHTLPSEDAQEDDNEQVQMHSSS